MIPKEITTFTFIYEEEPVDWSVRQTGNVETHVLVFCEYPIFIRRYKSSSVSLSRLRSLTDEFRPDDTDHKLFSLLIDSYMPNSDEKTPAY